MVPTASHARHRGPLGREPYPTVAMSASSVNLARFGHSIAVSIEPPSSEVRIIDTGHVHVPESATVGCWNWNVSPSCSVRIWGGVMDPHECLSHRRRIDAQPEAPSHSDTTTTHLLISLEKGTIRVDASPLSLSSAGDVGDTPMVAS